MANGLVAGAGAATGRAVDAEVEVADLPAGGDAVCEVEQAANETTAEQIADTMAILRLTTPSRLFTLIRNPR
ncbi:hypothetical protein [Mycobacterium sp. 1164966.3]|uniref:hypothetical protein n=1 Tax=Mycobacterium sp. 1164966.3 TaxID=1856861 RepID=UPI0012E805C2|nr:hypothetical protein [Mycobacterium sp. 1164966.3]